MTSPIIVTPYQIRLCLQATTIACRAAASPRRSASTNGQFRRSDFHGQGFTGIYEPGQPTVGPLGDASIYGAPKITPKVLKEHLDQFVVGQERAKKVLSTAVYNHYQRIQEIQRRDDEEVELLAQQARQNMKHPVEDEFPGQQPTVNIYPYPTEPPYAQSPIQPHRTSSSAIIDHTPLTIEKSNVLLLGPSGVGKTLMTKTLARVLDVPFSMSDCTPLTQAGYIGEDAEVCVQRLLAAANYDVARAERGIICLDEIDKIATAKVSHGKDVSGEGVQQALLKIIEGTTVQVQAKQEKGSSPMGGGAGGSSSGGGRTHHAVPTGSNPLGGGPSSVQPSKGDTYNINTDNILFICTGAFIQLHKVIRERISKGSIGFGAELRLPPSSGSSDVNDPTIRSGNKADEELFRKHLPYYAHKPSEPTPLLNDGTSSTYESSLGDHDDPVLYNVLDLTTPADLQKFGLIPEFVGRLPITCALSPLSLSALVRVLTEPRNSLLSQYTQLFSLSGIELRITSPALYEIAKAAQGMGTGARGLRTVMERLLSDAMFETPGSTVKYCLVTESVAKMTDPVQYFGRGMQGHFHELINAEEAEWERKRSKRKPEDEKDGNVESVSSFSEYRERATMAGSG